MVKPPIYLVNVHFFLEFVICIHNSFITHAKLEARVLVIFSAQLNTAVDLPDLTVTSNQLTKLIVSRSL
jgi:hypothetical protein